MLFFLLCICICSADNVTDYLIQYGYINASETALYDYTTALKEFQTLYNLPVDGKPNAETIELMNKPRCGVPDNFGAFRVRSGWKKKQLTWSFPSASYGMKNVADRAFKTWENVSGLTFDYAILSPDILISRGRLEHNHINNCMGIHKCKFTHDGPGHNLAHGFFPNAETCREIHVDTDENWYYGDDIPSDKNSFYAVLLHEIGHTLGLDHSDANNSIMYAYYGSIFELSEDDVIAIQYLYPPSTEEQRTTTTTLPAPTTTQPMENLKSKSVCDMKIKDVSFLVCNKNLYIISGKYIWAVNLESKKYVRTALDITYSLRFLPKNLTSARAIYQRPNGEIALFTDTFVYLFDIDTFKLAKRISLSDLLGSYSGYRIHGAVNTYTGRTFLFLERDMCLELDEYSFTITRHGDISRMFPGIPPNIDSVFRYTNGLLYFFKNGRFFEFDEFRGVLRKSDATTWALFDVRCPHISLYEQLKTLLNKILLIHNLDE